MSSRILSTVVFAAMTLAACGDATPTNKDVQAAVDRLAAAQPGLFGDDKPIINDAKCTKVGNETFDCVTSMEIATAAMTVTVKLTMLNKEWTAQIPDSLQ